MSEYSTSTATSEEQGSVSGDGGGESGIASDHSVSDASSRSERGDLSPESTTHDPGGSDRPSVGAGQRSADDGSAIGDGGMSTADAASAPGDTGETAAKSSVDSASGSERAGMSGEQAVPVAENLGPSDVDASDHTAGMQLDAAPSAPPEQVDSAKQLAQNTDKEMSTGKIVSLTPLRGSAEPAKGHGTEASSGKTPEAPKSQGSDDTKTKTTETTVSLPDGTRVVVPGMDPNAWEKKGAHDGSSVTKGTDPPAADTIGKNKPEPQVAQALRWGMESNDPALSKKANDLAQRYAREAFDPHTGGTLRPESLAKQWGMTPDEARAVVGVLAENGLKPQGEPLVTDGSGRVGTEENVTNRERMDRIDALGHQSTTLGGILAAWDGAHGGSAEEMRAAGQAGNLIQGVVSLAGGKQRADADLKELAGRKVEEDNRVEHPGGR